MRVISNLTLMLYSIFFFLIGSLLVLMALNFFPREMIEFSLDFIYENPNMRLGIGAIGTVLIVVTLLVIQIVLGKMQRERNIAFDNPDGQVTISLNAIEDFIKRLIRQIPEIKELKPTVVASKKGVEVMTRLILFSDTNIPEITERIQSLIKVRIQEILGIEESISVKVHIIKIAPKEEPKAAEPPADKEQPAFRGIEY